MNKIILSIGLIIVCGIAVNASTDPLLLDETRLCGTPPRNSDGRIIRKSVVLVEFERLHPRPQDGRRWYKDHVIPLACGGCDSVSNLQWLPEDQWREKSKWERIVYGGHKISPGCF